ncbi:hypothetical protein DACRYDRAFT_99950 [Dacryopinax primogenitus]|uniref:D-xylose 1-dehydrogenase (NADP(+), D-xylono-1,5-lactone-forming) n=1 Tax=Dacryopinax primogenitus (strain DJM 731) TaxID=1858805 RepID=M5G0M2_DACPD|nr:uncharacterized protein DACRYDRAFT_99950 [Dacryopinax primogenitus]EJU02289.1 hypothetical protein DACRYDRAFT_99950 [Dacryopinax primogenitus]
MSILSRALSIFYPPTSPKSSQPLRFGILGAAAIAPIALILAARSSPEAEVVLVGARNLDKAQKYAKKWGVPRAVKGWEAVLQDEEVDVVYNPLPNGLHYEWTIKALLAGKHVLLEKPATDTAEEAERIFALARERGLLVLEAFHYRFHPAVQKLKQILDSGELGRLQHLTAHMTVPRGLIGGPGDIRWNLSLGGGAGMDMGCYATNAVRYLSGREPTEVLRAEPVLYGPAEPKVDRRMEFTFLFPPGEGEERGPEAECVVDLARPWAWGVWPGMPEMFLHAKGEKGEVSMNNFVMPFFYHSISVRSPTGKRTERGYTFGKDGKGESWWTTYRYQLEAFVDKVTGKDPQTWVTGEDTVGNMKAVEMVYEKKVAHDRLSSLPPQPPPTMVHLRVYAGTSVQNLSLIPVNTNTWVDISSPQFEGRVAVQLKGYIGPRGEKPQSKYFERPDRKGKTWSVAFQGRFLEEISADDLMFGNIFDRPIILPWGTSAVMSFMSLVDPTLTHDLYAPRPWALSPAISSFPFLSHARGSSLPEERHPSEVLGEGGWELPAVIRGLGGGGSGWSTPRSGTSTPRSGYASGRSTPKLGNGVLPGSGTATPRKGLEGAQERKAWYKEAENRRAVILGPEDIITGDFCHSFLSFPDLCLALPGGLKFDLKRYWDGQPVRFVCMRRPAKGVDPQDGQVFWVVQLEIVEDVAEVRHEAEEAEKEKEEDDDDEFEDAEAGEEDITGGFRGRRKEVN